MDIEGRKDEKGGIDSKDMNMGEVTRELVESNEDR